MSHVLSAVAWPYANGPRHIGHVAGFGVPSDVFSRYMRMAGHDVLMVSGTDEHGTPILVAADAAGVTRQGARGQEQRGDRAGPRRPRPVLRPLHPYDDRQPLPRRPGDVHDRPPQRLHGRADHQGRGQPLHRSHAARPLHRGHLPDLRLPRRPRRPVRQLRQPARPDRPDQPAQQDQRRDAGRSSRPSTSSSTCPRSPTRWGSTSDEREASGTWRPNVIKFSLNLIEDLRPRAMTRDIDWGIPIPLDGWRDQPTKRSTSGSTRSSATCRRRSSGPAGSASPSAGATGGTTRRRCPTTSWARTTSSSTPSSGRPSSWRTTDAATWAASPARSATSSCPPRWSRAST